MAPLRHIMSSITIMIIGAEVILARYFEAQADFGFEKLLLQNSGGC